jgi:SIR2-like protein
MENVCYILGAGFSAPLGLPLMSNFLIKSKDMYFENHERYKYFSKVFELIKEMSVSKNYYNTDLFNIEEILSILDIGQFLKKERLKSDFIEYIKDVINFYTPEIPPKLNPLPSNWQHQFFGRNEYNYYGFFISCLHHIILIENMYGPGKQRVIHAHKEEGGHAQYSIITLNYDLIPENFCREINDRCLPQSGHPFEFKKGVNNTKENIPIIAKLHGSVDSEDIVPPTWSKGVHTEIAKEWELAYQCLVKANHIRFIGYSLPTSDAYVKYLLKSAVLKSPHLKKIDVLCKDSDKSVRSRYDDFVSFRDYRFVNADTVEYLQNICSRHIDTFDTGKKRLDLLMLEKFHEEFFKVNS